jgi:GntR family transcriptional regulator, transcriptional repressor for pyruvate dehydrogenase complex
VPSAGALVVTEPAVTVRADLLSTLTRRVLFAPLSDRGRADMVAIRLKTAITLGVLAEGERLPAEADLAAQLKISPVTLRDALTQLRDQGLVTTRRGRGGGTVVANPLPSLLSASAEQARALSSVDLRDLADWRRAMAAESARLAARRASGENLTLLARAVSRMASAGDEVEARRADGRFLIEVAGAAQSVRLSWNMISLQVEYAPLLTLAYTDPVLRSTVAGLFQATVDAVGSAEPEQARDCAVQAVDRVAERVSDLRTRGWRT